MISSNLFGWSDLKVIGFARSRKSDRDSATDEAHGNEIGPRGLIVRDPFASQILNGEKVWEIRGRPTQIRGPVIIVKSGTGHAYGIANLVRVLGPLDVEDLIEARELPASERAEIKSDGLPYAKTYAYVFSDPKWFERPVPYKHPNGAVTWVRLPDLDLEAVGYASAPREFAQLRLV